MADVPPTDSRATALAKTSAKFGAAWLAVYLTRLAHDRGPLRDLDDWVKNVLSRVLVGFDSISHYTRATYDYVTDIWPTTFAVTLFFGTGLAVLGAAARMVARARLRAGQPDFLDPVRRWTAAHPRATRLILAVPAFAWALLGLWPGPWELENPGYWASSFVPMAVAAWAVFAMARKGARELLAPTTGATEAPTRFEIGADEIVFDAVAVTRQSVAIVAVFSAIMLAVPAFIWTRPILQLFTDKSIFYLVGAYVALAATGALGFRKASRVAVGVDGVHVRGTSRARFFAYRDVDSARTSGADLELVRGGRVVLRLQLHSEDAARRDAVLERITANIARAREGQGANAARIVAASSDADLARAADGAGDYRVATLTREQLWALVEGPEIETNARTAAAQALARSSDDAERVRLRVAAEHCAEPRARFALQEIADDDRAPEAAPRAAPAAAIGRT
jgi:hypothetical protein